MVRRLIALGSVDCVLGAEHSALEAAAEQGNLELVKLLVENEPSLLSRAPTHTSAGLVAAAYNQFITSNWWSIGIVVSVDGGRMFRLPLFHELDLQTPARMGKWVTRDSVVQPRNF